MFSKVIILATASLALSVAAAPSGDDYECNTDKIFCCNQLEQAQTAAGTKIAETIAGLAVQGLTGYIGATCSPITVVGAADGGACTSQPVCCEDNYNNGAVVANCNPINAVF